MPESDARSVSVGMSDLSLSLPHYDPPPLQISPLSLGANTLLMGAKSVPGCTCDMYERASVPGLIFCLCARAGITGGACTAGGTGR